MPLLRPPIAGRHDAAHIAAGLPGMAALLGEALDAGVDVMVCEAGMAMAELGADALDPRLGYGGMVSLLAGCEEQRLIAV